MRILCIQEELIFNLGGFIWLGLAETSVQTAGSENHLASRETHLLPKSDSVYWVERSNSTANWPSIEDRMTLLAEKLIVSFFTAKLAGVEELQNV